MDAGFLSDRLSILKCTTTRGEYGEQVESWQVYGKRWCKVTYNRGQRALQNGDVWLPNTISILMRYDSALDERDRLIWDDKTYVIESLNRSKSQGSMTIIATTLDSIEDEQG